MMFRSIFLLATLCGALAESPKNGATYICDAEIRCACGAGQGSKTDVSADVTYRELNKNGGAQILRKVTATSDYVNDNPSSVNPRLFSFRYNSAVTQQIFFNVFDYDAPATYTLLGETDWFNLENLDTGKTYNWKITPNFGGKLETCPGGSDVTCGGERGTVNMVCYPRLG